MKALVYKNTHTKIPHLVSLFHIGQELGYAYKKDEYNIHIYGTNKGLWTQSIGLTASEVSTVPIEDWAKNVFGASDIKESLVDVGHVVSGVWRPGLVFENEIRLALSIVEHEQRSDEQSLRLLIEKLDDIFQYIEPSEISLSTFSHKTRELLILTCTEIENYWTKYMTLANAIAPRQGFSTNDYVKLVSKLHLADFKLSLRYTSLFQNLNPFDNWSSSSPSQSLSWYTAYNKTKHDRTSYFQEASLKNCIESLMGLIIMFSVRYSPFPLFNTLTPLGSLFNSIFSISLSGCDPTTFYVPTIAFTTTSRRPDLVCGQAKDSVQPWVVQPLII